MRRALGIILLLAAGQAMATVYYVAPGGNDGNPGTEPSPFLTIQIRTTPSLKPPPN